MASNLTKSIRQLVFGGRIGTTVTTTFISLAAAIPVLGMVTNFLKDIGLKNISDLIDENIIASVGIFGAVVGAGVGELFSAFGFADDPMAKRFKKLDDVIRERDWLITHLVSGNVTEEKYITNIKKEIESLTKKQKEIAFGIKSEWEQYKKGGFINNMDSQLTTSRSVNNFTRMDQRKADTTSVETFYKSMSKVIEAATKGKATMLNSSIINKLNSINV
jgi:hypothetical protein